MPMKNRDSIVPNIDEIDDKLEADIVKHKKRKMKITIISALVFLFIFRGALTYWLKFSIAFPSGHTAEKINIMQEPVQKNYNLAEQKQKTFIYQSLINTNKVKMIPQAHYVLSGRAVAINHDFLFISKFFDSVALYDLGTAWGGMTDKKLYNKYLKVYSLKTELTGARRLHWSWNEGIPYSSDYISSHLSHTHIIPANRNIMAAMLKLKKFEDFKIEGELVDMVYYDKSKNKEFNYHTSLSRKDSDITSRGSGSCETMYVTKVQIGKKIYK